MDWQAIDLAPKDGTDVILYDAEGTNVFEGNNVVGHAPYIQIGHFSNGDWLMVDEQCGGRVKANPSLFVLIPKRPARLKEAA